MKKVLFVLVLAIGNLMVSGQDLKKIKDMLKSNSLGEAKDGIEKFLGVPKNQKNPEAWYVKGKIYSAIGASATDRSSEPEARDKALDAFKKALEVDKTQTTLLMTVDNYQPVYTLYTSAYDEAAKYFNDNQYDQAFSMFKNTDKYGRYIFDNGWGLAPLDTVVTLYTALAASNAKKDDEAVTYFQKLADAKVAHAPEYVTSYQWLAKYYYDKKDEANMKKYVALGRELYPKDSYLPLVELDFVRNSGDRAALFAKFEEIITNNPADYDVLMEYAGEMFGDTHIPEADKRPADYEKRVEKIEGLYLKAIEAKPDSYEAMLSLGKHYTNQILFLDEDISKIKGAKPEDVKKKSDLQAKQLALVDKAIVQLEKVFGHYDPMGSLKIGERSNFKSACNLLAMCYEKKKDKAKSDFYYKKYDEADKTHG